MCTSSFRDIYLAEYVQTSYILNRGWIDRSAKRLPTYKEITSGKGKGKARAGSDVDEDDSADDAEEQADGNDLDEDEFDDVVDRFESSYNFRFEEPYAHLHQYLIIALTRAIQRC